MLFHETNGSALPRSEHCTPFTAKVNVNGLRMMLSMETVRPIHSKLCFSMWRFSK